MIRRSFDWRAAVPTLLILGLLATQGALAANPITISGTSLKDWPDPHITVLDGQYWIYPTAEVVSGVAKRFHAFSSSDLVSWTDRGVVLDLGPDVAWSDNHGWAPAIVFRNGYYYFFYSASTSSNLYPDTAIGYAIGNSPTGMNGGHFVDKGLLISSLTSPRVEAIDPMVFVDDDGQVYLYYGGSAGALEYKSIMAAQKISLNNGTVSLIGSPVYTDTSNIDIAYAFTEGAFVHKRLGRYFLTYSYGRYDSTDPKYAYRVRYAYSSSPMGPWTPMGDLLTGTLFPNPGHNSILKRPGRDEWYIAYHAYYNGVRQIALEPLSYTSSNTLQSCYESTTGVSSASPPTLANGTYRIISKNSNMALDNVNCAAVPETNIIQYYRNTTGLCQQLNVTALGDGSYSIRLTANTAMSLDRQACSTANETNVKLYSWWSDSNDCQRWNIVATGDNAFKIVAKSNPAQGLDVNQCSTSPGANVKIYSYWGGDCQRWFFESPSTPYFP
jgi:beta-xylosidase